MKRYLTGSPATYGEVPWCAEDVKSIRQSWSLERCETELVAIEHHLKNRLVELGWEVLDNLLPTETKEEREGGPNASL